MNIHELELPARVRTQRDNKVLTFTEPCLNDYDEDCFVVEKANGAEWEYPFSCLQAMHEYKAGAIVFVDEEPDFEDAEHYDAMLGLPFTRDKKLAETLRMEAPTDKPERILREARERKPVAKTIAPPKPAGRR